MARPRCARLAEADAAVKQIAAISGHKTLKEIEHHTKPPIKRN
jgi:hypothetical protein